ncbi:RTXE polymerase, partial [Pseudoatta argentina]
MGGGQRRRFDNLRWIVQKHVRALFEVPAVRKENHSMTRELLDTVLKHLRVLKALGRPTNYWDDLIIHLIICKLDVVTSKALIEFLTLRCQALESVHSKFHNNVTSNITSKHSTFVANVATSNLSCAVCKENHSIYHCKEFALHTHAKSVLKHIKLADPNFNVPASIDMLIGAESFWRLICAGQIKQSKNQPTLQNTHFEWIISGPQEDLFSILARFRTFKTALTADIAKIYRQVLIDSTQTPLQRIFWRESPDKEITALLQDGKFELRKWASNALALQDQNSSEPREFTLSSDKNSEKKALGIAWNCQADVFKYSLLQGRRSTKLIKCYIAIFICLANFVGVERELSELRDLNNISSIKSHGGLWEAAVKVTKRHLVRITRNSNLKREELETLLIQIKAILNSRPSHPSFRGLQRFHPSNSRHFLVGTPLTAYPKPSLDEVPVNRLSRWQYIQLLRQHFWKRWTREYLHHCQERNKWKINEPSVHVGQMVTIKEDNEEDLRSPYFRPPLQGVAKQLNSLADVEDRTAPVGKKSPSQLPRGGGEGEILDLPQGRGDRGSPPQEGHHGSPHMGSEGPGEPRQGRQIGVEPQINVPRPRPDEPQPLGWDTKHAHAVPRRVGERTGHRRGPRSNPGESPQLGGGLSGGGGQPARARHPADDSHICRGGGSHIGRGGVHAGRVGSPDPHGVGVHPRGGVTKTPPTSDGASQFRSWAPPITETLDAQFLEDVVAALFPKRERDIPERTARLVLLRKEGKPAESPSAYRPICLLDDVGKLLERVIAARIVRHLSRDGPDLSRGQYGFREGLSTIDAVRQTWGRAVGTANVAVACVVGSIKELGLRKHRINRQNDTESLPELYSDIIHSLSPS